MTETITMMLAALVIVVVLVAVVGGIFAFIAIYLVHKYFKIEDFEEDDIAP